MEIRKLIRNKKGSGLDWLIIPIIAFVAVIALIVSLIVTNAVQSTNLFNQTPEQRGAIEDTKSALLNSDNMILFIIVGLSLFVLLSSYVINNHPAMFFFSLILLAIAIFVAAIMSNTYETFSTSSSISPTASLLPKTQFLMGKLPIYICFMGFLGAILAYIGYSKNG